jgi:hypothetical protein
MADLEIPVALDVPLYNERVTLDGKEYLLAFDYSERENRWYLSVSDVNEKLLASGIKLVSNWPLLDQKADPGLPPGVLFAFDPLELEGDAPGFQDLGRGVTLIYREKA